MTKSNVKRCILHKCELWTLMAKPQVLDDWHMVLCISCYTYSHIPKWLFHCDHTVCEMLAVSTAIQRAAVFYSFYVAHLLLHYDNRQWILRKFIVCLFLMKSAHFSETSVEMIHVLSFCCLFSKSFPHRILPKWVSILPSSFLMWASMHDYSHIFLWNLMRPNSLGKVSNITLWLVTIWLGFFYCMINILYKNR